MRFGQIIVLTLGVVFISFGSATIQPSTAVAYQCDFPSTSGFAKPRNSYEAGKCNPATNGKIFAGKCMICRGQVRVVKGERKCLRSCKKGYRWLRSHPELTKGGHNEGGCCKK